MFDILYCIQYFSQTWQLLCIVTVSLLYSWTHFLNVTYLLKRNINFTVLCTGKLWELAIFVCTVSALIFSFTVHHVM